jgi:hypothetical protein
MSEPLELPPGTPDDVVRRAARGPRVPASDPRLGGGPVAPKDVGGEQRLVVLGDSLSHGFQSGAIFNTSLSYPALIARALDWKDYRFPRYGGPGGGIPVNIEAFLRELEHRFGSRINPLALFTVHELMGKVEDYWERGLGSVAPDVTAINHNLGMYGWALSDPLTRTANSLAASIGVPRDDVIDQRVEDASARAALRVYPHFSATTRAMTLADAARALGDDGGIETLVVFLGANNALGVITELEVRWSDRSNDPTVWTPKDFDADLRALEAKMKAIKARHVIWVTVPHVTIAPLARGVARQVRPDSRYFPFYTRPWITDADFDPRVDDHITDLEARAVDYAIDAYNDTITAMVGAARARGDDWYLFDIAGVLDRLAHRRYIANPAARPPWWTPYPLPPALAVLRPTLDSQFLIGDGRGGRAAGGLFSLDGVHPTTVAYGLIAPELIAIMKLAGVQGCRDIDFGWLLEHDSLVQEPPQNLVAGLKTIGWADQHLGWIRRLF